MDSAGFDTFVGAQGLARQLRYVIGQQVTYDSLQGTDGVQVSLLQFADPPDAPSFVTGFSLGSGVRTEQDAAIAGATAYDSATADGSGAYQHGVVASRGDTVMIGDYTSTSAALPPAVDDLARQQYGRLRSS